MMNIIFLYFMYSKMRFYSKERRAKFLVQQILLILAISLQILFEKIHLVFKLRNSPGKVILKEFLFSCHEDIKYFMLSATIYQTKWYQTQYNFHRVQQSNTTQIIFTIFLLVFHLKMYIQLHALNSFAYALLICECSTIFSSFLD